jgi:hypothetical protein
MDGSLFNNLTVTIVDKLIIGMIVLGAGYYLQKKFESYKGRQGFEASISSKRVEAISEVLASVADYEYTLKQVALLGVEAATRSPEYYKAKLKECASPGEMTLLLQSMSTELDRDKEKNFQFIAIVGELLQKITVSREKRSLAEEAINKNHFWIGKEFYLEMLDRMNRWNGFLECIKHVDKERVNSLYRETISEMRDVSSFTRQQFGR